MQYAISSPLDVPTDWVRMSLVYPVPLDVHGIVLLIQVTYAQAGDCVVVDDIVLTGQ